MIRACIYIPPPLVNQIVHVKLKTGFETVVACILRCRYKGNKDRMYSQELSCGNGSASINVGYVMPADPVNCIRHVQGAADRTIAGIPSSLE